MKKILVLITVLMSVILNAQQDFTKIVKTFEAGKKAEALAKINSILKLEPKNDSALLVRCRFYAALNELDKMVDDLGALSDIHPENVAIYQQRAAIYKYQKKFNLAIADYRKASKIEPRKIEHVLSILSILIQDKKDVTSGIAEASRIIHAFPKNKPSYFFRGYLWADNGDMSNAYKDLSTVVQIDKKSIEAYNAMAWWMATYPDKKYRNGAQAVKYALMACENSAWKNAKVIDTLAASYAEVGDFKESLEIIALALKLVKPTSPEKQELMKHKELFEQHKPVREYPAT